jgi:hypothetical protein
MGQMAFDLSRMSAAWRGVLPWARALCVGLGLVLVATAAVAQQETEAAKLDKCRSAAIAAIKPEKVDVGLLTQVSDHCQAQVRGADLLEDFNIRRTKYLEQQVEGRVLLWMVVALTVSGVLMAALQLFAAYRLAAAGHGDLAASSEITLEQSKVSLKSSVTGLLILVVSFAFFIVYVLWVFTIKETKIDVEAGVAPQVVPRPITLGVGGLGPPPKK